VINELFCIEHSFIQAPMAGVQGVELAASISNAGGLGSLPTAMLGSEQLDAQLTKLSSQTEFPYNVNFFCHDAPVVSESQTLAWQGALSAYFIERQLTPPDTGSSPSRAPFSVESLAVLQQHQPAVVSFHFGLPSMEIVAAIKAWGGKVIATATTLEEAVWLEQRGVDAIIAQGLEAGGHRGNFLSADMTTQSGLMAFLPQVCQVVGVPVIAAGGIASAQAVKAAIALGASGVQVGTAFLLSDEATTSRLHREALTGRAAGHTAITNVFTGRPARSIVNRLVREVGPWSDLAPSFPAAAKDVSMLRAAAEPEGISDFTPLWSGQNNSGCREDAAAVILHDLLQGFDM
jgi:nitronate monooxygenase